MKTESTITVDQDNFAEPLETYYAETDLKLHTSDQKVVRDQNQELTFWASMEEIRGLIDNVTFETVYKSSIDRKLRYLSSDMWIQSIIEMVVSVSRVHS